MKCTLFRNTKRFFVLMLLALLFFQEGFAQSSKRISLNVKNETVENVINMLKKEYGVSFAMPANEVDLTKRVTINVTNKPLGDVLKQIFAEQNLNCSFDENGIVQVSKKTSAQNATRENVTIKGRVADTNGDALISASVFQKGTTKGTVADVNGYYTINVPGNATLVFSYIGYETQEINVGGRTVINVTLAEEANKIGEVVVVGFGTQKRTNLTGAVATVSAEEINNRPTTSAANALQGADPALNLTMASGGLDAGYNIDIRGAASINSSTPLVMIDGVEGSLSQLSPNDIESVSILKDASAASIYGAKASAGVVLVTTKSGKNLDGKAQITYNGRMGWQSNTTSTSFITKGYDYISLVDNFYYHSGNGGKNWSLYDDDGMQMLYDRRFDTRENPDRPWTTIGSDGKYYYYANFDWYKYFFRTTRPEQEHNVSISGGNDKIKYYFSGRFFQKDGMFNIYKDQMNRKSLRGKVDAKLNNRLTYTVNASYNSSNYKYAGSSDYNETFYRVGYNVSPSFMPRNPDGSIVQYVNQMTGNSPLGSGHAGFLTANTARNVKTNQRFVINNQFKYNVAKGFDVIADYAYDYYDIENEYRNMPFFYSRQEGVFTKFTSGTVLDQYQETRQTRRTQDASAYGTYEHAWGKHNFKATAGVQYNDMRQKYLNVKQLDLMSEDLNSFAVATGDITLSQTIYTLRTLGYFGRINYDYDGKYLLELSARYDGTSRFIKNADRWCFTPAMSLGWRISREKFWEPIKGWWNDAKIRFSAGTLGNQQMSGYYPQLDRITSNNTFSYTFDNTGKVNYASISAPVTSNLTWEKVTTYNLGFDFAFLKNRLKFTSDFYIRNTIDMLAPFLTLPDVYGASAPDENCADLRTKGYELRVAWNDKFSVGGKPFKYNLEATLGDYTTEITRYYNPDKLLPEYNSNGVCTRFYEGMKLGEIWGYSVAGLFASDADAAAYQSQINDKVVNNRVYVSKVDNYLRAGDVQFIDRNGDNAITAGENTVNKPGDQRIIGNMTPRYSYSFRAGFSWNNIDFSIFFQGVGKRDWMPTQYAYDFWGPYSYPAVSFIRRDFNKNVWSENNTSSYFPRPRGYQSYSAGSLGVKTDRYIQSVAYLRLKNITIGYTLPLKTKLINSVRVYVTGENLYYWSPLKKYTKTIDPENVYSTDYGSSTGSGSGLGYPYSKSYSIGIDIKF